MAQFNLTNGPLSFDLLANTSLKDAKTTGAYEFLVQTGGDKEQMMCHKVAVTGDPEQPIAGDARHLQLMCPSRAITTLALAEMQCVYNRLNAFYKSNKLQQRVQPEVIETGSVPGRAARLVLSTNFESDNTDFDRNRVAVLSIESFIEVRSYLFQDLPQFLKENAFLRSLYCTKIGPIYYLYPDFAVVTVMPHKFSGFPIDLQIVKQTAGCLNPAKYVIDTCLKEGDFMLNTVGQVMDLSGNFGPKFRKDNQHQFLHMIDGSQAPSLNEDLFRKNFNLSETDPMPALDNDFFVHEDQVAGQWMFNGDGADRTRLIADLSKAMLYEFDDKFYHYKSARGIA